MKCLIGILLATAAAFAQVPETKPADSWADVIARGEYELKAERFDSAVILFTKAVEVARQNTNASHQADSYFYAALARQQQAAAEGRPELLAAAAEFYRQSIAAKPTGAALNNLARIWQSGENSREVAALYDQAIALKDEHRGTYALNYARWLEAQGQFSQAIEKYRLAASLIPDDPDLRKRIVELLSQHSSSEHDTMSYLWDLSCRGEADLVVEQTLKVSENSKFQGQDEQVAILAYALS